jgi:transcription elongation factor SPT6
MEPPRDLAYSLTKIQLYSDDDEDDDEEEEEDDGEMTEADRRFIVDDEEDEDAAADKARRKRRLKKKLKKRQRGGASFLCNTWRSDAKLIHRSTEDSDDEGEPEEGDHQDGLQEDDLEEDDLDLINENIGLSNKKVFKRLRKKLDESEEPRDLSQLFSGEDQERRGGQDFDARELYEGESDDLDDFIIDDDDEGRGSRKERSRQRRERLDYTSNRGKSYGVSDELGFATSFFFY